MSELKEECSSQKRFTPGYTIELKLSGQEVLVVGGGPVAIRKLPDLLAAGALISLIDPKPLPSLPRDPNLIHLQRRYQRADLEGKRLAFAITDDPSINQRIAEDAENLGVLCCRADSAADSDFLSPARLLRPPLTFSVSTGGESPAMASVLRDQLARIVPSSWQTATELAAAIRRKVLTEQPQVTYNQQVLLLLLDQNLLELIETADNVSIDRLLQKHFGAGFSLKTLQNSIPEGTT